MVFVVILGGIIFVNFLIIWVDSFGSSRCWFYKLISTGVYSNRETVMLDKHMLVDLTNTNAQSLPFIGIIRSVQDRISCNVLYF